MFVVEDFTRLPVGVLIPTDGPIRCCPRCGRNGAWRQRFDGTSRYVHVQTSRMLGDGLHTEPSDCCTFPVATREWPAPLSVPQAPLPEAPRAPGW